MVIDELARGSAAVASARQWSIVNTSCSKRGRRGALDAQWLEEWQWLRVDAPSVLTATTRGRISGPITWRATPLCSPHPARNRQGHRSFYQSNQFAGDCTKNIE